MMKEQLANNEAYFKWAVLGAVILALEFTGSQTLSNGFDRLMDTGWVGKTAAIGSVAITGFHLVNGFEAVGAEHLDPFNWGVEMIRGFIDGQRKTS